MASLFSTPKNLVGLVGTAALTSAATTLRSYLSSRTPFNSPMARERSYATRRPTGYKRKFKTTFKSRAPYGKARGDGNFKRLVRTSAQFGTIGPIAAGTSVFNVASPVLSAVQTSDLTAIYRYYRIKKIVVYVVPRTDPSSTGIPSNFNCMMAMCCDPEDTAVPANMQSVTAYDNSYQKFLTSNAQPFKYTFYPKVVNAVGNAGATAYVGGYGTNPWLQLNAAGIAIPHNCLKWAITCGAASTITFDSFFEYHFDVKGIV